MSHQIVEITEPGRWVTKYRGFLEVHHKGEKIGQVPLDDIAAVIVSAQGCSITTALMDHLCQRNIPMVLCGQNYLPSCFTLPIQGYGRQFRVMRAQADISEPRRKRAWQRIVRAKIINQAKVLKQVDQENNRLLHLSGKVKSGDPENCEAQAARIYWRCLFGGGFHRNQDLPGINAALNYVYAIVRACVARGLSSAGLHPSFSLHHKNPQNPLNLVDDLVEPFRPIADYVVWQRRDSYREQLVPENKRNLARVTNLLVKLEENISPLSLATVKIGRSFANYCLGEEDGFLTPSILLS